MKKIALLVSCLLLWGCPKTVPTPSHRGTSVSVNLPTAGVSCVTVHRNPKTNTTETISCTDSVVVSAPQHPQKSLAETSSTFDTVLIASSLHVFGSVNEFGSVADSVTSHRRIRVSVSETYVTTDGFICPKQTVVNIVETNLTNDQLTCGG